MADWITDLLDASLHLRAGRLSLAEPLMRGVLAREPDQPNALFMLGSAALGDGRPAEAAALLARVLALQPNHRDARLATGRALLASGEADAALAVLAPLPDTLPAAALLRGTALNALGRPADAADALRSAVAGQPGNAEAHLNLGNALAACGEGEAAEHHIRHALSLDPAMPEAHVSLGHLLTAAGLLPDAVAACETAIRLQPDCAAAHWNQGVAQLLGGDLPGAWAKFEWRKRRFPHAFASPPAGAPWQGEALAGRTLLVAAEQGLGDAIQFSRYLPLLVAAGATVRMECAAAVAPLLAQVPGVSVLERGLPRPPCDFWVDLMSLPGLFGTELATIPSPGGYLRPVPSRAAAWDRVLPAGLRVGVACAGNPLHPNDGRRSLPPPTLAPLAALPGVVSLQVGAAAGELAEVLRTADLSPRLVDFAETAALVASLDLVVTADTAVAHLAGALGIPVWVMLPHAPDWRWMLHRADSPWYASMRLFRQARPGDWAGVIAAVVDALVAIGHPPGARSEQRYGVAKTH